jgi:hypothetical protein
MEVTLEESMERELALAKVQIGRVRNGSPQSTQSSEFMKHPGSRHMVMAHGHMENGATERFAPKVESAHIG